MSIVRMKHLRLIALTADRDALTHDLSRMGALEITEPEDDAWSELLAPSVSDTARLKGELLEVTNAADAVRQHAKCKRGLFAQKRRITEQEFFSDTLIRDALAAAREINDKAREYAACFSEEGRLFNKKESLIPWDGLDVPLESTSSGMHFLAFGTIPVTRRVEDARAEAEQAAPGCLIECASSDREQHYLLVLCHAADSQALLEALRPFGFSRTQWKDVTGTAHENIAQIDALSAQLQKKREELHAALAAKADCLPMLDAATDALTTRAARAAAQEHMRETRKTVLIEGWFPERETARLTRLFDSYGAAYEIRDPRDDEEPPILTYNTKMVAPFGMITNMYSPPAYRGIDPNPFMAPFFALFFGIMLSDAAYGLILTLIGAVVLLKFKPEGGMKQAMSLAVICGLTTLAWGILFGGFFGDAIPTIYQMATGEKFTWSTAVWFNPLEDPMKMLVFSFILGGIHIFTGMAIQAYLLIRDGHIWDAVFDIGSWWVLLGGAVLAIVGVMPLGLGMLAAGALLIILTQGRHEKNIFKKFTKGLTSLYDVTSYLGDILSYSRLLALSLATAVIASVINTMGSLTGPIGFIIVFLVGHVFNIAVNLLGTFVHTSRLQYVEFFGKFYQGGGVEFRPLDIQTKYVDIIKEEQ